MIFVIKFKKTTNIIIYLSHYINILKIKNIYSLNKDVNKIITLENYNFIDIY
jgi:hypothetical protein